MSTSHNIKSIQVEGGFLTGSTIVFDGRMNCLIGGRGTGKTTVLELIRYALGLDPDFDEYITFESGENTNLTIDSLVNETDYYWRVNAIDLNTGTTYSLNTFQFHTDFPINNVNSDLVPVSYLISTAYPNPFNSSVNIKAVLPLTCDIDMRVYNLAGREVAVLSQGLHQAGHHIFTFEAVDQPSGIYLIRYNLSTDVKGVQKVLLVR